MGMASTKTLTAGALSAAIALGSAVAPASASTIYPHGGGFHGGWHGGHGGWHGGYGGGWRRGWGGGGWGWGPFVAGGLLAGAAIAATSPYYYDGYYGDPCYRPVPTYDAYGNYVGRHWARVC
jgi:uncharacterized membrane protein